ncbi:MAG: bifunctional (p)ppGpp synthetase/guanosine-3',5'-bis(diphosphate) 3'-pyrophosphohydrolase [Clostridiales bacterium]|nr:bifunctional (p)ppGpp synthetase/guanosine-3',5'-bis(diphosphate) 3'-pyrophosphohydrolase [Clostridiales bacterium]
MSLVERAYFFAKNAHKDQKRKSGEPYFIHPYQVSLILASFMLDATTIAACLLHDCIEDIEEVTFESIEKDFGSEVAVLVDGVTKLTRLNFTTKEDQKIESLRKMFLAMAKDIRVVLIKLADRLHNMRTLKFQAPDRQAAIARETLDIYAPLAHRLGMNAIKWELEDLSLRYIDPESYYTLVNLVGMKRQEREDTIRQVIEALQAEIKAAGIKAEVEGRPKHFYSIYNKMKSQNKTFDQIHDLIAIRVLVNTKQECYHVLGLVHTLWSLVPGRFKDYISLPKANMYQSLHTTVVGMGGKTFEVQIRTHEMHQTAEFGIAAHWRYKEGKQADELDQRLTWLRRILDWQDTARDPGEFGELLKTDLFSDEVFIFTPKGDVILLPRGATPLDFAYRIHSQIGNKCIGAKVNGRIVPLSSSLETGDFVEVMTSPSGKPSRDWLQIVKTSEAKAKIRAWFKHTYRDENLELGKDMLEKEAKRQNTVLSQLARPEYLEPVYRRYSMQSLDDLYVSVGYGALNAVQVINRLMEEYKKTQKIEVPEVKPTPEPEKARTQSSHSHGIIVKGETGLSVRFARCCSPLPGDAIVGYITRGRGVSVHRADCQNMRDSGIETGRLIDVQWENAGDTAYSAEIQLLGYDRAGLVGDLSMMFAKLGVPLDAIAAKKADDGFSVSIAMTLSIQNTQQLDNILKQLRKRSDVIEVYRLGH